MRSIWLPIVSLLFTINLCKANPETDSIKKLLSVQKIDSVRSQSSYRISWAYVLSGDLDSAMKYAEKALVFANRSKFTFGQAVACQYIGTIYNQYGKFRLSQPYFQRSLVIWQKLNDKIGLIDINLGFSNANSGIGKYDEALAYSNEALKLAIEIKDVKRETLVRNNIAIIFLNQANYTRAFVILDSAIKRLEEINDLQDQSSCYINLANVFIAQGNLDKALEKYQYALSLCRKTNDKINMALVYNNMGDVFIGQKKYSLALKNLLIAADLYNENGNLPGLANVYNNLGNVFMKKKELNRALNYQEKGLAIRESMFDKRGMASSYANISSIYLLRGEKDKALYYSKLSFDLSKDVGAYDIMKDAYKNLEEVYTLLGDFKNAHICLKSYGLIKDSLVNNESIKLVNEINTRFETDKKKLQISNLEKEKSVQNAELRSSNIQRIGLYCGLAFVIIILFVLFRNYRVKQKNNNLLIDKNRIIEQQKDLVEEKQKEIIDSINYAQRIQKALLASEDFLNENLNNGDLHGSNYFILFKPKDIVSGDFYWGTLLMNGDVSIAIADSTGHVVPGAIMSMLNIASLNEAIGKDLTSPEIILNETRKRTIKHLLNDGSKEGGKDGMDCSLLCIDRKNYILKCALANNPVWIVRNNKLIEIKPDKMPVGKHDKDNIGFTLNQIDLNKGDRIYAFTDGFVDQFGGPKEKKFKSKQLEELLLSLTEMKISEQKEELNKRFEEWKGNLEQVDDVCVFGYEV